MTVNAGSPDHIVISPDASTITAGNTQTYTAEAFDQVNNTLGDVTASTVFSIDAGAGGSWAANVYTSEKAGTWTVTGTYSGTHGYCQPDRQRRCTAPHRHLTRHQPPSLPAVPRPIPLQSFDQFDNPLGDVTGSTTFSITLGAGGSWAANVYTSASAGTWTVTGSYSGFTDTASLTVNAGPLHHIVISPDTATITAGNSQAYSAQCMDQFDNLIADVTASTAFSIDAGAGGSWAANVYTSANAGTWTVTGTYLGLTDTASLTVNAGSLHHIVISPDTSYHHRRQHPNLYRSGFRPGQQHPRRCHHQHRLLYRRRRWRQLGRQCLYFSQRRHLDRHRHLHRASPIPPASTVNAGALDHIVISPDSTTIVAGNTQVYTAQSFDQFNNPIADVTASTVFSIDAGAGGSWAANVYTSQTAGTWTVTGTYLTTYSDTASLTVNPGALHHIVISPDTATITAGNSQTYTAQSFDQFNNLIADISSSTVFSITSGAGGGWNGNIYTSAIAGTWTVTGTYIGLTDTASLTVNPGALHHIVISPDSATITAGDTQTYTAQSFDQFNNLIANVTPSTTFTITPAPAAAGPPMSTPRPRPAPGPSPAPTSAHTSTPPA